MVSKYTKYFKNKKATVEFNTEGDLLPGYYLRCPICAYGFNPMTEDHYISRDESTEGFMSAMVSAKEEPKLYDTFDCPRCGCQITVKERKRRYEPCVCEEEEEEDDENNRS